MTPSRTEVEVPRTSSRLMWRMVRAASFRASRAASPQLLSETPSSSSVLMTATGSPSVPCSLGIMAEGPSGGEPRMGEDELVAVIRKVLSGGGPGVVVGPGDDAVVVESPRGMSVLTTDMLVEDVHFSRALTSARDLGHKSIVVNVSDVAAMAASPRYALVSLGLSDTDDPPWVVELYGGMRAACDEYALSLVGGDVNGSERSVISVTVVGEVARGRAVLRSGARPGDRI